MKYFSFNSNPNWLLFVEEKNQWKNEINDECEIPIPKDIVAILDDIKFLFETYFDRERLNSYGLSVLHTDDSPCTFSSHEIIFLSSNGRFWSQYAYQFSHELCHFVIHANVADQMRWFEESICELASFFFIKRLSEKWSKNAPYPNWTTYSSSLYNYYMEHKTKEIVLPDNTTFSDFIKKNIDMLSQKENCYHRDINTLCANKMLPMFEMYPTLWGDVINIAKIPIGITFEESLREWQRISVNKDAIGCIIKLFEL